MLRLIRSRLCSCSSPWVDPAAAACTAGTPLPMLPGLLQQRWPSWAPQRGAAAKAKPSAKGKAGAAKGKAAGGKKPGGGAKKPGKKGRTATTAPFNDKDAFTQKVISFLVPAEERVLQLSGAELEAARARALEFNRLRREEHRAWQADVVAKLRLRRAALEALPLELRKLAEEEDLAPFPPARNVYFDSPPKAYLGA